ncbi:MAG: hypothetical protein ABIM42_08080, partial [candidate division WOR-3 bacterium]
YRQGLRRAEQAGLKQLREYKRTGERLVLRESEGNPSRDAYPYPHHTNYIETTRPDVYLPIIT